MYNLEKITLGDKICVATKANIPTPIITHIAPLCPVNFSLGCEAFVSNVPNIEHLSTTWELSNDEQFNFVIHTVNTTITKTSVVMPRRLLQDNTTYYARAYFITNLGESEWGPIVTLTSKFTDFNYPFSKALNIFPSVQLADFTQQALFARVDSHILGVTINTDIKNIEVYEFNTATNAWVLKDSFGQSTVTDPIKRDFISSMISKGDYNKPFNYYINGNHLYFVGTMVEVIEDIETIKGYRCFHYDTNTGNLTCHIYDLSMESLRDNISIFFYNDHLYFLGGFPLVNDIPTLTNDTYFIKWEISTNTFTPVESLGEIKPINLAGCKCLVKGDDVYIFSTINIDGTYDDNSKVLWLYSLTSKTWTRLPALPVSLTNPFDIDFDQEKNNLILINGATDFYTFNFKENIWSFLYSEVYPGTDENQPTFKYSYISEGKFYTVMDAGSGG